MVRLRRRETALWTSDSDREECEEERGETGEDAVEDTVQVESAEAGRRAVCGEEDEPRARISARGGRRTLTLMCVGLGSLRGQDRGLMGWPMTKAWTGTCMAMDREGRQERGGRGGRTGGGGNGGADWREGLK